EASSGVLYMLLLLGTVWAGVPEQGKPQTPLPSRVPRARLKYLEGWMRPLGRSLPTSELESEVSFRFQTPTMQPGFISSYVFKVIWQDIQLRPITGNIIVLPKLWVPT
uniref:Uncharacterized protein n=1 Tax=Chrysemys picta bellii TaxID=8478 RepID=A0A8C3F7S3_CHRPI